MGNLRGRGVSSYRTQKLAGEEKRIDYLPTWFSNLGAYPYENKSATNAFLFPFWQLL